MNKTGLLLCVSVAMFNLTTVALGHGWSPEMRALLQAEPPEWLRIGKPIRAAPASEPTTGFRAPAGDSQSTRDRVLIPGRKLEIKVDYPIDWYFGSSLSPDGTKLIINSESKSHLLLINADGTYQPSELRLPYVTYDTGPKGFINGWSWASDDTLIGAAEIDNEKGEFLEQRIYIFQVKHSALTRLDFNGLGLPSLEGLTVAKVGEDLDHLMVSVGGKDFPVKVDLHSAPTIEQKFEAVTPPKPTLIMQPVVPRKERDAEPITTVEEPSGTSYYWLWAVGAIGLILALWRTFKR